MLDSLQKNAELASRYIDNLASTGQAGDVQAWMQEYFESFLIDHRERARRSLCSH